MEASFGLLDSFATKWIAAEPELGLASSFLPGAQRTAPMAFACLQREIEYACFVIRDQDVATAKLTWWYEELLRAAKGESRHPIMQALANLPGLRAITAIQWQSLIAAALIQREREPAADFTSMLAGLSALYDPLVRIEAQLLGASDAAASARVAACAQALRQLATVGEVLDAGQLPLPLDLLARHQLTRESLRHDSPSRRAAVAAQAALIAQSLDEIASAAPRLGLLRQAGFLADRRRARTAAKAQDPTTALAIALQRVPITTAWGVWRAARR